MPHYYYKAVTRDGTEDEGEMVESSAAAVIRRLQDTGRIPILTEEVLKGGRSRGRLKMPADGMESEFIVRSGHSCQGHPFTIEEVRRILLEHLGTQATPTQ